jgi:hypothetical protein
MDTLKMKQFRNHQNCSFTIDITYATMLNTKMEQWALPTAEALGDTQWISR